MSRTVVRRVDDRTVFVASLPSVSPLFIALADSVESDRVDAEAARAGAESARDLADADRIAAEVARDAAVIARNEAAAFVPGPSSSIAVPLFAGWVNSGGTDAPLTVLIDNGVVTLNGSIKSGLTNVGTQIALLPVGYRPLFAQYASCPVAGGSFCQVRIDPNGAVTLLSKANATRTSLAVSFDTAPADVPNAYDGYLAANRIYVSSVAYGGIPVGNDTTGAGTAVAPYLTIDKAYTVAAASGKAILLNGNPAAPTDYRHATFLTAAKEILIDSVAPYGASISSTTTTTRVIHATVLGTLALGRVTIDGRGVTPAIFTVPVGATPTTLRLRGTKFIGFTQSITNPSTLAKLVLDASDCISTVTDVQAGGFYGFSIDVGSAITVTNCTFNITSQTAERGAVQFRGNAAGMTANVSGNTISISIKPGLAGSGSHSGVVLYNFGSTVTGNTINVSGNVAGHNGFGVIVSPDPVGTAYPVTGSLIADNAITATTNGGIGVQLGQDVQGTGADAVVSAGCVVTRNSVASNPAGQAGSYHGILVGSPGISGASVSRNSVVTTGLALVDKVSTNTVWESNVTVDASGSHFRIKGAQGATFRHNTAIEKLAGYAGKMVQVTNNDVPTVTNTSGAAFTANSLYASGLAASGTMTSGETSQVITYLKNNYYGFSGAVSPFRTLGVNYASLAAWQAVVPTATGVDPLMVNVASGDFDLIASSPLSGRITRTALTDYAGSTFADPASAGAFEAS